MRCAVPGGRKPHAACRIPHTFPGSVIKSQLNNNMKANTVEPKKTGTARYMDMPEPDLRDGSILVEAIAVGVCGTDVEIMEGKYWV